MTSGLLPPSPNWYCSRASDTSQDGTFAFATKNTVFLLNTKTSPPSSVGSLQGHLERVSGISFCTAADQVQQCVTSSDDRSVKLWDITTKTVLKEHTVHQFKLTAIHWSPLCKDLVVSGDEKGALVCWDLLSSSSKLYIPEAAHICSLACSPHNSLHVAVGYKTSNVLLVDINNKGNILHKLRGHADEIHSVCWCPIPGETLHSQKVSTTDDTSWMDDTEDKCSSPETEGALLLSGSKDRTIRVWGTSNGKLFQTLQLPSRGVQRTRDRGDDGGRGGRVWVALYWIPNEERMFICSSHSGDVLRCDLSGTNGKPKWDHFGTQEGSAVKMHMRIVFNIVSGPSPDTVISTSMDRKIICWNTRSLEADWILPSLGGFVYRIAASPLDQSRLAIGVGDNMIRVWNTATIGQICDVTVLWQGIKSKVTVVCWHPTRENCLAYATDDGRVGIYTNLTQSNKPPLVSSTYHRKTVYALSWGPQCPAKPDIEGLHLYSCGGEGAILQHDPSNLQDSAINVSKLILATNDIQHILPQRTDVSWRLDGRAVAMGNEDGSIDVFAAPNLLLLCTIHVHNKLINCLQWYPLSDHVSDQSQAAGQEVLDQSVGRTSGFGIKSSQSEPMYWLASASNDPQVHVYELGAVFDSKELTPLSTSITSSMCCLSAHTVRVTALSWSPHGDGRLVSSSYDGSAQVWDVLKREPVANYRGHTGRIFTCYWSALDEDIIYTGSEDFTLRKWKVSECQHKCPLRKKKEVVRYQSGEIGQKSKKNKKQKQRKDAPVQSPEPPSVKEAAASIPSETSMVETTFKEGVVTDQSNHISPSSDKNVPVNLSHTLSAAGHEGPSEGQQQVKFVNEMGDAESSYLQEASEGIKEISYQKIRKDRGKRKRQKSLFPVSSVLDSRSRAQRQADCVQLAKMKFGLKKSDDTSVDETTHLGFFSGGKAMYDIFREEASNHVKSGYIDLKHTLGLWKGNLIGELEEAKQQGTLSDMLVSMASVGGPDVWLEVCEAYAQQLETQEEFVKAASYYVACHQVPKAIYMLMNNRHHREAVAIAAVRLPSNNPLLTEVYRNWAAQLEKDGSFEQAAKCFLAINQPACAIRLLSKKGDPASLRASLEVAILAKQETMATRLMARYVNESMLAFDWSLVQEVTSCNVLLQAGQLLVQIHETIAACWIDDGVISAAWYEDPQWSPWQQVIQTAKKEVLDGISGWPTRVLDDTALLQAAVMRWSADHSVEISDKTKATALYQWIVKAKSHQGQSPNIATKQLLSVLAIEVILGKLSLYMDDVHQTASHWFYGLVTCHNAGEYDVAKGLISLILPKGKASIDELRLMVSDDESPKKTKMVLFCLEAYYVLTVLYYQWWGLETALSRPEPSSVTGDEGSQVATNATASKNTVHQSVDVLSTVYEQSAYQNIHSISKSDKMYACDIKSADDINKVVDKSGTDDQCEASSCKSDSYEVVTLFAKLQYLSATLLSESHAKYTVLKQELTRIQQGVTRLVATHASNDNPQNSTVTNNCVVKMDNVASDGDILENGTGALIDSNPASHECGGGSEDKKNISVDQDISHDTNKVDSSTDINNTNVISSCTKEGSLMNTNGMTEINEHIAVLPEDQLPDTLIELTTIHNSVLKEISLIPAEIKEHPFPDCLSSAKTIVYFSRQAARLCQDDETSSRQLQQLCNDTAEWGHRHSCTERDRRFFSKFCSTHLK